MDKRVFWWEITGIIITIILGFIFHFAYSWLGEWKPSAIFFAVNESVWEHLKIAFWPAFIFAIVEYNFIKDFSNNFFIAKATEFLVIILTIVIVFYSYTSLLGSNVLFIDISLFIIAIILGYYASYKILTSNPLPRIFSYISIFIIILLVIGFSTLTYNPLYIDLFRDSSDGSYGIKV